MKTYQLFGVMVVFLLMISISSAATCAERSYSESCNRCSFDSSGKMNQACYQQYQTSGEACLAAAYPIASGEYAAGQCPAIDVCISRLQECKALYTTGSDQRDCGINPGTTGAVPGSVLDSEIGHCFVKADNCVAVAVKNCSGTPPGDLNNTLPPTSWCDGVFFLGAVLAGTLFTKFR